MRQDHGVGPHSQLAGREVTHRGLAVGVGRRGEPVARGRDVRDDAGKVALAAGVL